MIEEAVLKEFEAILGRIGLRHPGQPKAAPDLERCSRFTMAARWVHEPVRLNVLIEAPRAALDDVIAGHDMACELVENAWLHLFQIDEDGSIHQA